MNRQIFSRSGFNLTEVLVAVLVIATAFIPIIGLMGTSFRATVKNENLARAMNLCQDKLEVALKFPFDHFQDDLGDDQTGLELSTGVLKLDLKNKLIKRVPYRFVLRVANRSGKFSVRSRDLDKGKHDDPSTWKFFASKSIPYQDLVHRYTMTVFWRSPGKKQEHFYSLVTFRANLKSYSEG